MRLPFVSAREAEAQQQRMSELDEEYRNYRRRTADTRESARLEGRMEALKSLLPVYDNLLRALQQPCSDEAFLQGIRMTLSAMEKSFAELGVTEIPAEGCPFDPMCHEAMEHIEDESLGEGMVAQVILPGFRCGEVVLRHALVVAAN